MADAIFTLFLREGLTATWEDPAIVKESLAMQALAIAAAGMTAAANRLTASAERTATWNARETDTDLVKEAVEQISAKTDFAANVAVARTADAMTGALLDLKV